MLWNDAGGNYELFGVSVVFDDGASGAIPDSGPVVRGSYQVSQYGSIPLPDGPFPAPNPGMGGGDLSLFNGLDPNGTWKLYAYDDSFRWAGGELVDGWSLTFETQRSRNPRLRCCSQWRVPSSAERCADSGHSHANSPGHEPGSCLPRASGIFGFQGLVLS